MKLYLYNELKLKWIDYYRFSNCFVMTGIISSNFSDIKLNKCTWYLIIVIFCSKLKKWKKKRKKEWISKEESNFLKQQYSLFCIFYHWTLLRTMWQIMSKGWENEAQKSKGIPVTEYRYHTIFLVVFSLWISWVSIKFFVFTIQPVH